MASSDEEYGSEEEFEDTKTKCLFCDREFESPQLCLDHCSKEHGFDFKTIKLEFRLGLYDGIKVINYLRADQQFKNTKSFDKTVLKDKTNWDDEKYLKPVIADDPLVMQQLNGDDEAEDFSDEEEFAADFDESVKITENNTNKDNVSLESLSKEELIDLLKQAEKKNTVLQKELEDSFEKITKLQEFGQRVLMDDGSEKKTQEEKKSVDDSAAPGDEREDGYFAAYSRHHIHEDMLKDEVRTGSYHDAVIKNTDTFKEKVVLDVGCGTGILSMFAAKAGSKKVVAVDNSSMIARAKYIAKENHLDDKINFIKGKMEEIHDLGVADNKVDIIISEWMGYCLLFEAMLDTVLVARDKFLKPDGLIFPNKASMLICAYTDKEYRDSRINYWKDIYGFKMETMTTEIITEAIIAFADEHKVFSDSFNFKDIDIKTVQVDDLNFTSSFKIVAQKDEQLDAFVLYFDIDFDDGVKTPVHFSTGPFTPRTHWATTICYLNEPVDLKQGEVIEGSVTLTKGKSFHRDLDILVIYSIKGKVDNKRQFFNLS